MSKRIINKVAVLGSGVMGSRIACHFANIGVEVLLMDIPCPSPTLPEEKGASLGSVSSPSGRLEESSRNKIVNDALVLTLKSNPSPIYKKSFASRITTGNFEDDMPTISSCDWVIEAIVEKLEIKKQIFEKVEKFRKPGTLVTTNTSGIPIHLIAEERSEDFQKHFCGTHFFNPPRYLKLLEIIPGPKTAQAVIDFLKYYGDLFLGKTTVLCKDTPAFIANRIGVFGIMALFHLAKKMELTVEEVDKLTGPVLGRPKSATFRTCDVVGLDTLVHVANGLAQNLPHDEAKDLFNLPVYVAKMNANKWLGDKTGQGFYKKIKSKEGKSEILALDLNTLEYKPSQKVKFATLEKALPIENLKTRLKVLISGKDKAGEFYRASFFGLFQYVSNRIPEISDELYKIDDAMKAGFGWELGPFEYWDALGVEETVKTIRSAGYQPAQWVDEMLASGRKSFYEIEKGLKTYYDKNSPSMKGKIGEGLLSLEIIRPTKTVWKNSGATVTDIGDGIINLEWNTKMNSIGGEVIEGINKAIDLAEKDFRGLVISNEGQNFSAGANVGMIFMMAVEQEWDELNFAIKLFQDTMMRVRYSAIPVVVAPHNLTLGGACELSMHSDKMVAHAETYMGLVEFGVGLIPAGGGTKEFALRLSDELQEGDIELNNFRDRFLTIGQAKVSTSAYEAFDLGYLQKGKDIVVISRTRLLAEAKKECMVMAEKGYSRPVLRKNIRVLGKQGLGLAHLGTNSMFSGNYISKHDVKIAHKLAYVLCGGDLSAPTLVSEQYLLDLEREAFLSLCGEKKTLERIQSVITGGKVLRN